MKKIFALILIFSLLFSFNANASKNVISNDFEVKNKVFDEKIARKSRLFRKFLILKLENGLSKKPSKNSKIITKTILKITLKMLKNQ